MSEAPKKTVKKVAKPTKEVAPKIVVGNAYEILATTEFDKALKAEIKKVQSLRKPGVQYKRSAWDVCEEAGLLYSNEKLVAAYVEVMGHDSKLSSACRSVVKALGDAAFLKVAPLFEVKKEA